MVNYVWVLAAVLSLPTYHEDRAEPHKSAQLAMIASAVADEARDKEEAALVLTIGAHESGLSYRIHTGRCRPLECDRGRAIGLFQTHRNGRTEKQWLDLGGLAGTKAAVHAALFDLRRARGLCRGEPNMPLATLRAYGSGHGCREPLRDEASRMATFRRLLAR